MHQIVPQAPIEIGGHIFLNMTHIAINGVMVEVADLMALAKPPGARRKLLVESIVSLQRLALAGTTGECDAHEACDEIANRLPDILRLATGR